MTRCAMRSAGKVPLNPVCVKKRRKAIPSTTCGIIKGDRKSADRASRPRNRWRAMASAAGTANRRAMRDDTAPSQMLIQNALMNSG